MRHRAADQLRQGHRLRHQAVGQRLQTACVFQGHSGSEAREGDAAEPVAAVPMWSNRYPALEPGKEWSLVVMSSPDDTRKRPVLEVSWRGLIRRKTRRFGLANANTIETGWPGKTKMETDAD